MSAATATRPPSRLMRVLRHPISRVLVFFLLLIVFGLLIGIVATIAGLPVFFGGEGAGAASLIAGAILNVVPVVLAYLVVVRLIEGRAVSELRLRTLLPDTALGVALGALLITLVVGMLWLSGSYRIVRVNTAANLWLPIITFGLLPGISEEIITRGIIYRISEERLGTWIALLLSALLFGFGHIFNPNATVWSALAIAIEAGLLLGIGYAVTRSLWFVIGLHAAWNVVQGPIFGVAVSGIAVDGLIEPAISGPAWLTGGPFGAEASVIAVIICGLATILLGVLAQRRGQIRQPFWRARRRPARIVDSGT